MREGGSVLKPNFSQLPVCVGDVTLRVARGHFATGHSHINYLIDVTAQKASLREAEAVAQQLFERYLCAAPVDTILCLDGTRVIGACLARRLMQMDGAQAGRDMYVLREEADQAGNILVRDNARHMYAGKNRADSGGLFGPPGPPPAGGMACVEAYGGRTAGIAAIYSRRTELDGIAVMSLFDCTDLPDYASYPPEQCPFCQQGRELDAVVNSFGYTVMQEI